MPRRARIVATGHPMHVILRGIDRAAVFIVDDDRRFLLDSLSEPPLGQYVAQVPIGALTGLRWRRAAGS